MIKKENLKSRAERVLSPVLSHYTDLEVTKAKGSYVIGADGKKYLDFASGIAATNVGHCHPKVVAAICRQSELLIHTCAGVAYYESNIAFAEKLKAITPQGLDMSFLCQSGSEANEAAIKLAKYVSKRSALIAFNGGFHGRTLGALSVTFSNPKYREGYEPLIPNVYMAPYANCYRCEKKRDRGKAFSSPLEEKEYDPFPKALSCSMECLADTETVIKKVGPTNIAALIVEPIQGEGGYIVPPKKFIQGLKTLCENYNLLLIFDEVQTGFGRTGKFFAAEHFGLSPDIMAVAKAIASGLPLGGVIAREDLMRSWLPGAHGSTMQGNPVTCEAALATVSVIENEKLLANAGKVGRHLKEQLIKIQGEYNVIGDVRGVGLMVAAEFVKPGTKDPDPDIVKRIREECLRSGLLLISCGSHGQVIRFIPPLIITKEEINTAMDIFKNALKKVA